MSEEKKPEEQKKENSKEISEKRKKEDISSSSAINEINQKSKINKNNHLNVDTSINNDFKVLLTDNKEIAVAKKQMYIHLFIVFLIIFCVMVIYQLLKLYFFPNIDVWQSNIMTIIFSSIIATFTAYLFISEYNKVTAKINELMVRQKAILDNIPDIAWLKDRDGRFIIVNEPFAKSCGYPIEQIMGKTDLDIWPKENAEKYRADDIEVMESRKRKSVDESLSDKEGKMNWIETIKTPIFDSNGKVIGTTGIARDITTRMNIETELKKKNEELKMINDISVEREMKMVEMKKQIEMLQKK